MPQGSFSGQTGCLLYGVPSDKFAELFAGTQVSPYPEGSPLTQFGSLEKGKYYIKLGRTTGVTSGLCNGALACCNWTGRNAVRYDHNGKEIEDQQNISEEYVIVGKKNGKQTAFAEDGDSGSFFVPNVEGDVCGLLFGTTTGHHGDFDYMFVQPLVIHRLNFSVNLLVPFSFFFLSLPMFRVVLYVVVDRDPLT